MAKSKLPLRPKEVGDYTHKFDLVEVEKVCQLHPTDEELAAYLGCSPATIKRRKAADPDFQAAYENGRGKARLSLRRAQIEKATNGDSTMLIWLGKQLLGQRDYARVELTGADGGPVQVGAAESPAERIAGKLAKLASGAAAGSAGEPQR